MLNRNLSNDKGLEVNVEISQKKLRTNMAGNGMNENPENWLCGRGVSSTSVNVNQFVFIFLVVLLHFRFLWLSFRTNIEFTTCYNEFFRIQIYEFVRLVSRSAHAKTKVPSGFVLLVRMSWTTYIFLSWKRTQIPSIGQKRHIFFHFWLSEKMKINNI